MATEMETEFIDLNTDAGVIRMAGILARGIGRTIRGPFITTPPDRRQMFAEAILANMMGNIVAMVGVAGAKEALAVAFSAVDAHGGDDAVKPVKPSESLGKAPNGAEVRTHQNATAGDRPLTAEEEALLRDNES